MSDNYNDDYEIGIKHPVKILQEEAKKLEDNFQFFNQRIDILRAIEILKLFSKARVLVEGRIGINKTENQHYIDDLDFKYICNLIDSRIAELLGKKVQIIIREIKQY